MYFVYFGWASKKFFILFNSIENAKPKFIIDNDAGGDDAMAIFLALLYEKYFDG